MVQYEEVDLFIGGQMGRGVTDPDELARLVFEHFGEPARAALQEYRQGLKGEIAKGENADELSDEDIEYVARVHAVDALVGDILVRWPAA